jgi:magnesium transporter
MIVPLNSWSRVAQVSWTTRKRYPIVLVSVRSIRGHTPDWTLLLSKIKREFTTGALLGVACALIAGILALSWKADPTPVFVLVGSVVASVTCAAVLGLVMPYLFRWLNRGPQVAAGPIALASADVVSLLVYFNFARWFLS